MQDLSGLPPTYLTVNELDPLRDEGLDYAQRLLVAGVPTEVHCFAGTFHGFVLVSTAQVTQRALVMLRRGLGWSCRPARRT
jgi:acetyl esterase